MAQILTCFHCFNKDFLESRKILTYFSKVIVCQAEIYFKGDSHCDNSCNFIVFISLTDGVPHYELEQYKNVRI